MKRLTWMSLFAIILLWVSLAYGTVAPPLTSAELPAPPFQLPVISDIQFSGDTVSFSMTGDYSDVFALFYVQTPTDRERVQVEFNLSGGRMTASLSDVLAKGTDYYMNDIRVVFDSADCSSRLNYYGDGAFRNGSFNDLHTGARYNLNEDAQVYAYRLDDLAAYYKDGMLSSYTIYHSNGYDEYDSNGELLVSEFNDPVTGQITITQYQNGALQARYIRDNDGTQHNYDGSGTLRARITVDTDGVRTALIYDVNGILRNTRIHNGIEEKTYDAAGILLSRSGSESGIWFYEEYKNAALQTRYEQVFMQGVWYLDTYKNGVLVERSHDENGEQLHYDSLGNYLGKTVIKGYEEKRYNAKGQLIKTVVDRFETAITYDGKNNFLQLEYSDPYFSDTYLFDAKSALWYINGALYDGPPPLNLSEIKLRTRIVWYPNNTICSFGPNFRDIDPSLTDLWYMFTPIDLSKDGTQSFELIAGNMYVLGQVFVTVSGDSVTVTYSTIKEENNHVYMKSEYLNFFPDLQRVTTVVPEEIGPGFAFGKPISIQKDLNGDTNVLLFIRNVATFRNYVTNDTILRRYYKNNPNRKKLREQMLQMMD